MPFRQSLQSKLTFSHLAVTIITALLLALLILGGTVLYLRSDAAAFWAGEVAQGIAYDLAWQLDGEPLDGAVAWQYILAEFYLPMLEEEGEIILSAEQEELLSVEPKAGEVIILEEEIDLESEWFIIFDRDNRVLASSDQRRFAPGATLTANPPPGFDEDFLQTVTSMSNRQALFEEFELPMHYAVVGNDHIGHSAILGPTGEVLGGVYFRQSDVTEWFLLTETLQMLGLGLLGAAMIATIVSGVTGNWLARSFGRRIARLNAASAALAAGDLDQRVLITGHDEIDQLGVQFNTMADQIGNQVLELRQLAERNALLAEEARALAALEERQRLARELHDALKQQLFGLSLTAGSIRQLMARDSDKANERLTQLAQQARDIYIEMDRIIHQLRPAALEDRGLAAALPELLTKWERQHDLPVELEINAARELSLVSEQALYRICQEALNNIARHAQASQVTLSLQYDLDEVTLHITDDGCGFDETVPRPTRAMGIRGMEERISEIGGHFTIKSSPNEGTTIMVMVPARFLPTTLITKGQ